MFHSESSPTGLRPRMKRLDFTNTLMLTAKDGLLDRVRSRMIGAHDYITKPFRVPVVVERVKGYLAELYPPNTLTPGA